MRVKDILRVKGNETVTLPPETDITTLLSVLAARGIGAVVVSRDGSSVDGIVSERDVVRAISAEGVEVLSHTIASICTQQVQTVTAEDRVDELMRLMTDQRIRHVPVVADGQLRGMISIGDVVKNRIGELETEAAAMSTYISQVG